MHTPNRSDSFDTDETVADGCPDSIHEYREAVALLQEEVARLERELQLRDHPPWESVSACNAQGEEDAKASGARESARATEEEVERLTSELNNREQTVTILLDQLSLLEEAKAADRAEWERLIEWVTELEKRVEAQDEDALRRLEARVGAQTRGAEERRAQLEHDRRGWDVARKVYDEEIARLRSELAQAQASALAVRDGEGLVDQSACAEFERVKALEAENLRLRAGQAILERTAAENSSALRSRMGEIQNESDELERRLAQIQDERRRERLEYETTIAELRTTLSQFSVVQHEAPRPIQKRDRLAEALEPDIRVRALRQHLLEIHQREEAERRERRLTHRLTRLWSRTSPR
jgi:hypothetical protein